MNSLIFIAVFLLVLFIYIHVVQQFKRSEDLEIYEMDYQNNAQLQDVCDLKQPVLFEFNSPGFSNLSINFLESKYGSDEVRVFNTGDYWSLSGDTPDYIVVPLSNAKKLCSRKEGDYVSENNHEFVDETGNTKLFRTMDEWFKPGFTVQTKYDIMFGSNGAVMPMRYHTNYRYFMAVTSGKIRVKMSPWKTRKYLHPIADYDNYEFRSPVNVWSPQAKYLNDMDKAKFLEFDVLAGHVLYIPPYWFYSIKYSEDTCVCGITYVSAMNFVANLPNTGLFFIQQQNITRKPVKTMVPLDNNLADNADIENPISI